MIAKSAVRSWLRRSLRVVIVLCPAIAAAQDVDGNLEGPIRGRFEFVAPSGNHFVQDQDPPRSQPPLDSMESASPRAMERDLFRNIIRDQRDIWTAPLRIKRGDLWWQLPVAALTAELIHRDAYVYRRATASLGGGERSRQVSNGGLIGLGGAVAGMYVLGRLRGSTRLQETGILSLEASINSVIVGSALKYTLRRSRPEELDRRGHFFQSGGDSFPSDHSLLAWSIASVLAHQYPGPLTKVGAYGVATAVSISRVTGRKHFASDAILGAALGWAIGRHVYQTHKRSSTLDEPRSDESSNKNLASPYVPLDSWVYPDLELLAANGMVDSAFLTQRPWTRTDCARMVLEARSKLNDVVALPWDGIPKLIAKLESEFAEELTDGEHRNHHGAVKASLYTRATVIRGNALTDGYHFGQTIANDFGRPYREGWNSYSGFSVSGARGRLAGSIRGEFQYVPGGAPPSAVDLQIIAQQDRTPLFAGPAAVEVKRFHLIEAFVTFNLGNLQFTLGKQSRWWGPGRTGSLTFSNNAEALPSVRLQSARPFVIPWLHFLGPMEAEFFFGKLAGHEFVSLDRGTRQLGPGIRQQPYIHGISMSLKPHPRLEIQLSSTTIFAGPGFGLSTRTFFRSFSLNNNFPGNPDDPGDSRASMSVAYRLPFRASPVLYAEGMTEDEFSPLSSPAKSGWLGGLYFPHLPWSKRVDLRLESAFTDSPGLRGSGVIYFNDHYQGGFTHQRNLLGHFVGRQGKIISAATRIRVRDDFHAVLGLRGQQISPKFIPQGGRVGDIEVKAEYAISKAWSATMGTQIERWQLPALVAQKQFNQLFSFQLTYTPTIHIR